MGLIIKKIIIIVTMLDVNMQIGIANADLGLLESI